MSKNKLWCTANTQLIYTLAVVIKMKVLVSMNLPPTLTLCSPCRIDPRMRAKEERLQVHVQKAGLQGHIRRQAGASADCDQTDYFWRRQVHRLYLLQT